MNELHRMQYLDALGIDQYVPRRVLPHSAPLRLCELPEAVAKGELSPDAAIATDIESSNNERQLPKAADAVHRVLDAESIQKASEVSSRVLGELGQKEKTPEKKIQ